MISLVLYFSAIYLTIVVYAFLPRKVNRLVIMIGIHIGVTVPSSFYLAKALIYDSGFKDSFFSVFTLTILFTVFSLLLSGLIVKKIK